MIRRLLLAATLLLPAVTVHATDAQDTAKAATAAYQQKHYPESAALYAKALALDPANWLAAYNGACSYALAGDPARALTLLAQSLDLGFLDARNMENDTDLVALHADPRWPALLAQVRRNQQHYNALYRSDALAVPFNAQLGEDQKLAGLAKFWSEVKYNLLDEERLKQLDWDSLLLAYLPKVRATTSTAAYYEVMAALAHQLGDGASGVWPPEQLTDTSLAAPPFRTRLLEGRIIVYDVYDEKLHDQGVVPGVEVIAVDDVAALSYARDTSAARQFSVSAQRRLAQAAGTFFLRGDINTPVHVRFAREDGSQFTLAVQRIAERQYRQHLEREAGHDLTILPGNIAYLRVFDLDRALLTAMLARAAEWQNSAALIIDLRASESSNTFYAQSLLQLLMPAPFQLPPLVSRAHRAMDLVNGANSERYTTTAETVPTHASVHYAKPLWLLTSPLTGAAEEVFLRTLQRAQRATALGERTGGTIWSLVVPLPGGGRGFVGAVAAQAPAGQALQLGIAPDIAVAQTVADMRRGVDTVLEAALAAARAGVPAAAGK